ncbi:DUF4232 domain-containing protein [Amycolatopsis sp. NPDC051903]|uniref:DUF4232 domain-containing protein n=1 Tax=Amycolatopsis sp. NPDC051903 TaxID=3363936 RepID=UPI003791B6F6
MCRHHRRFGFPRPARGPQRHRAGVRTGQHHHCDDRETACAGYEDGQARDRRRLPRGAHPAARSERRPAHAREPRHVHDQLSGSPELRFLGGDGSPLDLPIREVDIPGPPTGVTLKPGTAAFAGVQWTLGDKADPDALVANNFELTPPGTAGTITVDLIGTDGQKVPVPQFPIKSVRVGTLQPAPQSVLVF